MVARAREVMMPETRSYEAKDILCLACDEWFVFTAKEQRFYAEQGFPPPKRCPSGGYIFVHRLLQDYFAALDTHN